MTTKQQQVREKIIHTHHENLGMSHYDIARSLQVPKSTVTKVIKNFDNTLTVTRKKGSGRKKGPASKKTEKAVVDAFKKNPNLSVRDVAKKVKMSSSYVQKAKKRAGLSSYKVNVAPNRNDEKNATAKTRARLLYNNFLTKYDCVILDDETYIKSDFKQIPGKEYYVAKEKGGVPPKFKAKKLTKYPKKYLIWQAICTCGRRSQIFTTTGNVNQDIYVNECLQKKLLPFIKSHKGSVLFWPDLATCHYGRLAKEWYEKNNIVVVPKEANPPNCPELRPIETYWAQLKTNLRKTKATAKDISDFKRKCKRGADAVHDKTVLSLMEGMKRKVRIFAYGK